MGIGWQTAISAIRNKALHPTHLITDLNHGRVILEKLTRFQLVKKFPAFYGIRRFIPALTSDRHLSLSWATSIQSISPHPASWKIHRNIILPSTPRSPQWTPSIRFPHQDPIHSPLLTHTRHMPSPSHSSQFCHPHNIGWAVQLSRPPPTYKLGTENHMLQLNI